MKLNILLLLVIFASMVAGCAAFLGEPGPATGVAGTSQKFSSSVQFQELDNWLARNMLAITAGRNGNDYERSFSQGSIIVYGEADASPSIPNPAQKRLTAQRAAEVVAQRNLADFFVGHERFGEIRFRSYTVKMEAFLKGASVVATDYDATTGRSAVLLKLDLRGARAFAP